MSDVVVCVFYMCALTEWNTSKYSSSNFTGLMCIFHVLTQARQGRVLSFSHSEADGDLIPYSLHLHIA